MLVAVSVGGVEVARAAAGGSPLDNEGGPGYSGGGGNGDPTGGRGGSDGGDGELGAGTNETSTAGGVGSGQNVTAELSSAFEIR